MRLPRAAFIFAAAASAAQNDPYARMQFPNRAGLDHFRSLKFGLFIHYGPVSQWGTEISFPLTCSAFPCVTRGPANVEITINDTAQLAAHREAYAALATTFNPTKFDAVSLAAIARGAGFRYVTYTAEHCDGFSNWNATQNRNYSIMTTPFGRDIVGELLAAFRAADVRAGVYVCPSTWNNDLYWAPDAQTAFGGCCSPNYDPLSGDPADAARWDAYVRYLHKQVQELIDGYAPSHFWFDSGTSGKVDTRLEELVGSMRAANPDVVMHVRDGGVWHDYIEPNDHSEAIVGAILGLSYSSAGDAFEVPGTLGEQWAYDPKATYKSAATVIKDLVGIVSKGGNYLMNIGLDSTGVWAPDALVTLANLTTWFAFCGEAIHNTSKTWPYAWGDGCESRASCSACTTFGRFSFFTLPPAPLADTPDPTLWFTASDLEPWTYVFFFAPPPNGTLLIPPFKPATLAAPPVTVKRLTQASGPVDVHWSLGSAGLFVDVGTLALQLVALTTYYRNYSSSSVDRAPCATRDCTVYTQASYTSAGDEGACLTPAGAAAAAEPTVALNLFFNGAVDNMAAPTPPADGQTWSRVDDECSIFVNDGAGRWPVEVWHNVALSDYWTLASPTSRASAAASGYVRVSSLGFVADTAPPPSAESYAYVLRVEWA